MGACTFAVTRPLPLGRSPGDVFREAVQDACHYHGHGGYTGTIAEKHDFVLIDAVDDANAARRLANKLVENEDPRIDDKWGPAGAILYPDHVLFFGWASS